MSDDFDDDELEGKILQFPSDAIKYNDHPLESVFGIESGTTVAIYTEREPTPSMEYEGFDDKDHEIEQQFQDVYNIALQSFDSVTENVDTVEGKYVARVHEVAANYLNVALAAAKEKKELKQSKDKLEKMTKNLKGGTTNNNIIVSHTDILDMVKDMKFSTCQDYLEGEVIDPDPPT